MPHLVRCGLKTDQDPRFMEIWGFGCGACIDQYGGCFYAVCFAANPVNPIPKGRKHFAAYFPAVQFSGWISSNRAG